MPIGVDATGWIDALDGVTVVSTGSGQISGLDARYWDLVSERPDSIAILGDGSDWLPETILDPGQTVRLWSIDVGGSPLLVTLHPASGGGLGESSTDLDLLLSGLVLGAI